MKCKLCGNSVSKIFSATVLSKYRADYNLCGTCGFLSIEDPYWLSEAYRNPINITDTGILQRNIYLSQKAAVIISLFFSRNGAFLDFGGGYGLFTRLMRDIGFDFYWHDPYTPNLFARGFEYDPARKIDFLTVFESFEHFADPLAEIERMLPISKNILFTTLLVPAPVPPPGKWWYYGLEHGQHISFYTLKSLKLLATKHNLDLYTNGIDLHLITPRRINQVLFNAALRFARFGLQKVLCGKMISKTFSDMTLLAADGKFKNESAV